MKTPEGDKETIVICFSDTSVGIPLLDAHLHLTHAPEQEYPRSFRYFTNAAHPDEWSSILSIRESRVFSFLGIHPECGPGPVDDPGWEEAIEKLRKLASTRQIGIGEIGIDNRFYDLVSRSSQILLFSLQLQIARDADLPVTVHQVHALDAVLQAVKATSLSSPWILHGFAGSLPSARQILDLGGYISLNPSLLLKKQNPRELLGFIPSDRLLLESDYPHTRTTDDLASLGYAKMLESWYGICSELLHIDRGRLVEVILENGSVCTNRETARA